MPNVFSHPYQLDESISDFLVLGGIFHLYSNFKRHFFKQTVENAESHKMDARLIWVNFWHAIKTEPVPVGILVTSIFELDHSPYTMQSLYNTPHYNTDLDITRSYYSS